MVDDIHVTRSAGDMGAAGPSGAEPALGDLFRQLAQDSATLVKQEVALAKAEMRENVKGVARDAAMVAVGGVTALVGVLVLILFLVLLVGEALGRLWLGALIVGALFLIVGGVMAKKFLANLKHDSLAPDQTIRTLKEDKQWVQSEIQQAKRL
ncbi:MAG TPA: phage holin family protein [Longimicrobiaceae bacterium]|jgi:uncharacterized membrane protein YqjE|nr:phage holin family protein [Longimicrobiaceae bacterium]